MSLQIPFLHLNFVVAQRKHMNTFLHPFGSLLIKI